MLKKSSAAESYLGSAQTASAPPGWDAVRPAVCPPPAQTGQAANMLAEEYQEAYLDLARSGIEGLRQKLSAKSIPAAVADVSRTARTSKPVVARAATRDHALDLVRATSRANPAPAPSPARNVSRGESLAGEVPHAIRAHDNAVAHVRKFMAHASRGRLYVGTVDDIAAKLVESLERNPDALLCLPRLRQRDNYTWAHCVNVSVLLAAFAMNAGEPRETVMTYAVAGLLHDMGKAFLPVSLLCARRSLSVTEQALVLRHPRLGCELLSDMPGVRDEVLRAALEHHERFDGSGYPGGLSGKAISRIGHLTAIADCFDAISSFRPYKEALFPHRTLGVMYKMRQKHFHPELMERFVRMVGIYPVGSIVELDDGYRGVVTAGNADNPMLPVVTLAMDRKGRPMPLHECDLALDNVAGIARCFSAEMAGFDPAGILGFSRWC